MKKTLFTLSLIIMAIMTSCHSTKNGTETPAAESTSVVIGHSANAGETPRANYLPRAVIYKTSGDFDSNVPVTLDAGRTSLVSYPAPTDLTDASTPVRLADGWLLDRRGITPTTAFTRWTYDEYAALPAAPSAEAILAAVIPGARVTEIRRLPFYVGEATDTEAINRLITDSLTTLPVVYAAPTLKTPSHNN